MSKRETLDALMANLEKAKEECLQCKDPAERRRLELQEGTLHKAIAAEHIRMARTIELAGGSSNIHAKRGKPRRKWQVATDEENDFFEGTKEQCRKRFDEMCEILHKPGSKISYVWLVSPDGETKAASNIDIFKEG